MSLKIFLVLCVGLLAINASPRTNQNDIDPMTQAEIRGFIDDAKELWEKLKNAVEDAVNKAVDKLQEILESIKNKAKELFEEAKAKIEEEAAKLLQKLSDLEDAAHQAGVDISDCTKENEDALKNLGKKLEDELLSCLTDKVNEATGIVDDAVNDIKGNYNEIVDLGHQIDDCGSGLGAVLCIGKIVTKMTVDIVEIPADIALAALKATELVTSLKTDLETCAALKVAEVAIDGASILAVITDCVNAKLNP